GASPARADQAPRNPPPREPPSPRTRSAAILRRSKSSSLTFRKLQDSVGDDAELNFRGTGVDHLRAGLQIDRLEAAARDLHGRKLRQRRLRQQLQRERGKALMC